MKTSIYITMLVSMLLFSNQARSQSEEMQQLILNIEKLAQFRKILKNMKDGYEMLAKGYNTVKDLTEGNFNLHDAFLDGLLQVSPAVRNYHKVGKTIDYQIVLVREYRSSLERFRRNGQFTAQELAYVDQVYENLLEQSVRNLEELTDVLTAGKMRMSDDERLENIDRIYLDMQNKVLFLRSFNNQTSLLSLQRAKEANDTESIRRLYNVTP